MSTLAERVEDMEPVRFTPAIVRHDSILDAMKADRGDSYGYHVKDFLNFAESTGGVSFETVRDYFRELNSKPYANSTKRLMRQIRRTNKVQAVSAYLGHSSTVITMNYYVHERLDDDELFDPEDGE